MKSMTGYGVARGRLRGYDVDIHLRAVNGRFLETRFHLPKEYYEFEAELKKVLVSQFARGTLDIYVARKMTTASESKTVQMDRALAAQWVKNLRQLGRELKIEGEPNLELLSRVPDILKVEDTSGVPEAEKKAVITLMKKAAQACDRERLREGQALRKKLQGLLRELEREVQKMAHNRREANQQLETKYREKLAKLGFEGLLADQRMAQEMMMHLDRSDIDEEIQRLGSHLHAYTGLLSSSESQGKKMDFYAQELLREVNTIGSKSQVAELTECVVQAKTLIERLREQVQNIE